jgi:TPR repeat protein
LASQQGEFEADMALSKWFLCGSEGAFDKDESLAYTFAEKAARKGLPSAEFAMGYYMEVGVGGPKDVEAARKWYTRVSKTHCHLPLPDVWLSPLYTGIPTWERGRN